MPQAQQFSQIWDLCRNTVCNINFHYRTNSVNMTKFFNKFYRTSCFLAHFWSIFPIFGAENFAAPCQLMILFQENIRIDGRTGRQKDRRKDRQTLFYRVLPATAGDPKRNSGTGNFANTLRTLFLTEHLWATISGNCLQRRI